MNAVLYTKSNERPTTSMALRGVQHQARVSQRPHRSQRPAEDNYQSAPGTCHSSVNPRTYKSVNNIKIVLCQFLRNIMTYFDNEDFKTMLIKFFYLKPVGIIC